jgi:two-component system, OmpR family, phosphate regulon sensor histidine kinase PhoR
MSSFVVVLLILALAAALWILWAQRRFIRHLSEAIANDQALLRATEQGFYGNRFWNRFRLQVNALIDELKEVRSDRAMQIGQLQATLESIREAVLILDGDNRIVLANDALCDLFCPGRVIGGRRVETVFKSAIFLSYIAEARSAGGGAPMEIEFLIDERSIWAEVTCSVIPDFKEDEPGSMLFVLHNITRLKHLESMRKEFVANVSHELRTPLSMIKGYVETLVDGGADVAEKDRERFLKTIQKHTERLHALLEDLLTISRLESRREQLSKKAVVLQHLTAEIAENYREAGVLPGDSLRRDLPAGELTVFGDSARLTQVLENLIDNAVKYSADDPKLEIGASEDGEFAKVWVKDNGVGISRADLPHIFERFYRVDKGRSRERGGTGLGLSIVKHIVQLHGGKVWAESTLGVGTTFFFHVPLYRDPPAEKNKDAEIKGSPELRNHL